MLHNDVIPSGRSFMKIKNKRGPKTDPCVTPEFIFLQSDVGHLILLSVDDHEDNL